MTTSPTSCALWLFVLSLVSAAVANGQGTPELKHYWDFEGASPWDDKAGQAHGLVPEVTTLSAAEGKDGAAATAVSVAGNISGDADYLAIDGTALFQPGAGAFSFSYWFRIDNDGGTNPRGIFDFSGNGRAGVQSLFIGTTNELAFRVDAPGPNEPNSSAALVKVSMVEDDAWHFVVATYDPVFGLFVHLDGFGADGFAAAATGEVTNDPDPYLGSFNHTGAAADKGLDGELDDFAIYSGVLDQGQIAGLFDGSISPLAFLPERAPFAISRIERGAGATTIFWNSEPGASYSIWSSPDLVTWDELDDGFVGTGEELMFDHPNDELATSYRIQRDPQ